MGKRVRVVQFGCGPIGTRLVRIAAQKPSIKFIGAIDLVNLGKDLGELAKLDRKLGVTISNDADRILRETKPDLVLHTTGSSLKAIYPQLETIVTSGVKKIVSTCEELAYPYAKQPTLAESIDRLARNNNATILATGVNPGFLMDTWPLVMTGVCEEIKQIKAVRIQDASYRRLPFQQKIGAGRTVQEFQELVQTGALRHVGLPESIAMIAGGLSWNLSEITEKIEPVIAEKEVRNQLLTVPAGRVAGVRQIGYGWSNGEAVITLDFQAYVGARDCYDAVYITGTPSMEVVIKGGVNGDIATVAMVVNSIPRVLDARAGLLTMRDLPIVTAWRHIGLQEGSENKNPILAL
jgi:4-hydroxy-tetrahydrodipicolinate reductase